MNLPVLLSFGLYLLLMLGIGIYFYRITHNLSDYILGGRGLPPSVAALSAGASDLSGWALMGLPGAIFSGGLSQAWIAVWTLVGVYLNWTLVAERLRVFTEAAGNGASIGGLKVTTENGWLPSAILSSTPVTVTSCGAFQLSGVKVTLRGATVASLASSEVNGIVTSLVGF